MIWSAAGEAELKGGLGMCSKHRTVNSALSGAFVAACAAMGLAGCAPAGPSAVEADFGASVRAMIAAQTVRDGTPTPTLDGKKSQKILEVYRDHASRPEAVSQDMVIGVGN
ncbi:MAG: hypothetical protein ACI8PT_003315 [Gammaproteobacteria bacterium]|jgi:hypothetical protein